MSNILIIFHYYQYPMRATIRDHLYSFQKYSNHRFYYLNLGTRRVPKYIKKIQFDLIIFHTIFLSSRWAPEVFKRNVNRVQVLKNIKAVKIVLPQDEFFNTNLLCEFINEFEIDHVFTVAPESEWAKIYSTVDFNKVHFHQVLTGYLDDDLIAKVNRMNDLKKRRQIYIGYRAWRAEPWLGSHGILKTQIADIIENKARERGLETDISTKAEDTILGDDWYRFLLNCKYTIGVEGGASVLDVDGSIREQTNQYLVIHPKADFEEIREACLKEHDNYLRLFAISPRHLEACLTRTCQILLKGHYNNILIPGKHYIELERDFKNIDDVLDVVINDHQREEIIQKAYEDIVESGAYSYRGFVHYILKTSLGDHEGIRPHSSQRIRDIIVYYSMKLCEIISWIRIAIYLRLYAEAMKMLPKPLMGVIWKIRWAFKKKL